jgi:plastocyanin
MPRLTPALVISLALAAAAPATASAAPATVSIVGKSFGPAVTVAPGDTVTWNWGSGPHNVHVTSGPETFDSGIKDTGGTYTRTLTAPGTYAYQCDVHPTMHGTVVVGGPAAATTPTAAGPAGAVAPALRSVTVSSLAVVRLSSATAGRLSIRLLRDGRVARRSSASLTAGANRVPLSVRGLPRGRYRVQLQATSAAGRRSATVVRSLLVTRAVLARRIAATPAPAPAAAPVAPPAVPADDHGGGHHHAGDAATPPA